MRISYALCRAVLVQASDGGDVCAKKPFEACCLSLLSLQFFWSAAVLFTKCIQVAACVMGGGVVAPGLAA